MTIESLENGFLVSYLLTGAAFAAVLVLGRKKAIRAHLTAVTAFAIGFAVVLFFAEALGRKLAFEPTIERIHLTFAFSATAALLGPLATGFRRLKGWGSLKAHRIAVGTFIVLFVSATTTGVLMLRTGQPRVEVEAK